MTAQALTWTELMGSVQGEQSYVQEVTNPNAKDLEPTGGIQVRHDFEETLKVLCWQDPTAVEKGQGTPLRRLARPNPDE